MLLENPRLCRKLSILPYQALGACFNPYRAFLSLQKTAGVLPLNRKEEVDFKPQLPLKRLNPKRSLKEDKPELPLKSKNHIRNITSSQLFPALSPNHRRFG
jgi:hypothetical protein